MSDEKKIPGIWTDDELDLHATTDASVWASEFNQVAQRLGYSPMDEGWLIGWFANAMFAQEMAIRRKGGA